MKCFIENFLELDIDELLAVNGGYGRGSGNGSGSDSGDGGGGSGSVNYGSVSSSGKQSSWDVWIANKDGRNSSGEITRPHDPYRDSPKSSGNYKATSFVPDNSLTSGEGIEKQVTDNPNDYHCDIKAWNAAIDAGFDPRGTDGVTWDGNTKTVNQLFNEHYKDSAVTFDSSCAGMSGYLFYDWGGDGIDRKDHVEFCTVSLDGTSYTFGNTDGIKEIKWDTRYFSNDSNARAGASSTVVFVPLEKM